MKILQFKLVGGFILAMISWRKDCKTSGHLCEVSVVKNFLKADCVGKGIHEVPQDLDENLKVLDLSNNTFSKIDRESFKRYGRLVSLRISYIQHIDPYGRYLNTDPYLFSYLSELIEIELTLTDPIDVIHIEWPKTLKTLICTHNILYQLFIEELNVLEKLDISSNKLQVFPKMHPEAPLEYINMNNNPLGSVELKHIAPYCRLEFLGLEVSEGGSFNRPKNFCRCKRFEAWMLQKNIRGVSFLVCTSDYTTSQCDLTFENELNDAYNACKLKRPSSHLLWQLIYSVLIIIVTILIGIMIYILYRGYKNRKNEEYTSGQTSTELPPDEEGAEEILEESTNATT